MGKRPLTLLPMKQILIPLLLVVNLASWGASLTPSYPKHWWTAVAKEKAPTWEVLPQEVVPGEVILSKRHELGLLSNFAATPFLFRGKRYASLEGFWQAMLYPENAKDPRATFPGMQWKYTRSQVEQMSGFEAKGAGDLASENMKTMKIDWVSFEGSHFPYWTSEKGEQYRLIEEATQAKVDQNPKVKAVLLSTKGLKLRPDHHQPEDAPPSWHYFDILTAIRDGN